MKKKIFIMIMTVVLAIGCLGCFVACDNKPVLTVGITDYEPMDYKDADGNWIGFDADLARAFAEENGYKIEFQVIEWDSKTTELNSGNIDLIWNGMTADEDLGKQMDFSVAYATNMQCIVVKKTDLALYTDSSVLATKRIAVETGSAANTVCNKELMIENKDLTCAENQVRALIEVMSSTSDAAMVDYTLAYNVVGKNDYADLAIVDINTISFGKEVFAVGVKQGSELTAKLNTFFAKKYADGTLTTLAQKYNVALNEEALKEAK